MSVINTKLTCNQHYYSILLLGFLLLPAVIDATNVATFEPKRASSCTELWLRYNITQSGNYTLDLSVGGSSTSSPASEDLITVECDLRSILPSANVREALNETEHDLLLKSDQWIANGYYEIETIVHHDSEETKSVQGYESPGSFVRNVHYYTASSLRQIERIINSSFTCQQFIRWECRGSTFSYWYPKTHHSWWVDRHGVGQNYWGNAEPNSNSCGCFPNCFPTLKNSTCNCDANLKSQWLEDSGLILEPAHLPVTQLRFGDTGESYEGGKYTLGPLVCRHGGHRGLFMGSRKAPTTIVSPGYPDRYPPAFRLYEWHITVAHGELIELVFPDYDIVHYGAYNSVPGCRHALEIDIYIEQQQQQHTNETSSSSSWTKVESIKREKASPPYYVTDGRATKFVMRLITCNQVPAIVQEHKGFKAEFRQSKCTGCNIGASHLTTPSITTHCRIDSSQCVFVYSIGYPFPHYLYGTYGMNIVHMWNLTTNEGNILQIEFNDFDVNSTPGQHNCDADLLTLNELYLGRLIKKVDYCNINRFNIGKFHSGSSHALMILRNKIKKVGNSRGIHATVRSIPAVSSASNRWVSNAAEGKPTDQSTTREAFDAALAVDGSFEQRDPTKCSSTSYEREPWWRVNLQKRHRIYGVTIYSLIRRPPQDGSPSPPLVKAIPSNVNERAALNVYSNFTESKDVHSSGDEAAVWPAGDYALPMPISGCPQEDTFSQWLTGMRFHAVQHDKPYDDKTHYWSDSIMLKGGATGLGIEQHFCVHSAVPLNNNSTSSTTTPAEPWMPGKYCIFQYGPTCPDGFHSGSITWFDKSHNNRTTKLDMVNSVHGHIPSGLYTSHNTTINFCCRDDGNPEIPIRLPKARPFYLLQYGQICQEVEGMSEVEHFFHYEEEVALSGDSVDFIFTTGQQLKFQDPHPRVDATLFDRGLSLHYCYYDIADKLKGFQILVDTTPDTFGYGRFYDEESGIARPVNKQFLSAVECASYSVTSNEFDKITLNCTQPIEGQYVIIFMKDRKDALQLCEVIVFGEESCGRPLGMATEEVLDSAITASSFDQNHGLLYHPYNARLNSPKAWCAANSDPDKYIQIDLRLQNSNIVTDSKSMDTSLESSTSLESTTTTANNNNVHNNYVTIVGVAMQGMQMTFKSYFVTQFQLLFSNDSIHWIYEEEPIGKQKIYKCVQCDAQHIDGNEVVMYNLLKPIVARFIRIKVLSFRLGPCMRLDLIGCRGDKKNFCSRTLTASTPGVISSPNYPFYYAQYKSCLWQIKPSNSSGHIELDFIVLDLAPAEKSGGKCHDQLLIYHSTYQSPISIEAGSLTRSSPYRQQQFPKKIISHGPITLNLTSCFRSSMSRYQGFLLRFRETDCPGCGIGDGRCARIHNCTSLCGRILSINYPLNYLNSHRCQWLIRAPPGHYFNVTIEDFDIEDTLAGYSGVKKRSQNAQRSQQQQIHQSGQGGHGQTKRGCIYDHLSFTDASNGMLLGRYCNSNKPPKYILSNWNELLIEFSTDSSKTGRGFKLKYKAQKYQLLSEAIPLLRPPQLNACPFGWQYFRGYCYSAFVESESLQWYQAEEKCSQKLKGRDGHLVSITDYLEMNVVHYWVIEHWKMTPHQSIYIGLIDTNREGFYNWSDGNPMSYTDWYRSNPYQTVSQSNRNSSPNWSVNSTTDGDTMAQGDSLNGGHTNAFDQPMTVSLEEHFIQHNQPDGGAFEDCTVINFYSIHSTANWHDIPCSLGKKVMPVKVSANVSSASNSSSTSSRHRSATAFISDGLIRSYICKMDSNSSAHQHSPRKPLFTNLISSQEREALEARVNGNRYFVCNNYEVISNLFRCDGTPNCRDGSDEFELDCPVQCLDSQFRCGDGHCIAIGKYCDFVDDCGDGSDEINCIRRQCKKNAEFKCNNDQCIPISKRCDLLPDCRDQSDEGVSCTGGKCNLNSTFQCYYGTCIPLYTLCDKHRDCPGKFYEDEHESVCSTIYEMENANAGSSSSQSNSGAGNSFNGGSAFDLMRTPLRSPAVQGRFFRLKRDYDEEDDEEDVEQDEEQQLPLSAYILRLKQQQQEKLRKIRNASTAIVASRGVCSRNRRRTCQDLLHMGVTTDGYYELQPSGHTKLTMIAYCRFLNATHAMTIVNHDTEDRLYVRSSVDGAGSFVRSITYESSFDLIVALIDQSAHCRQMLSYECSGSGFYFNTTKPNSWWVSRGGKEYYWGGHTGNACACYPNCSQPGLRCNCDSGLRFNWTRDYGYVEDRAKLPILQLAFGEVYRIGQLGYVQVGQIECIGNLETDAHCGPSVGSSSEDSQQSQPKQVPPQQQQRKFKCHSGQTIESQFECIYEFDQLGYQIGCRDVSQLRNCATFDCPADYVKCPNSYCIPHRYICNGKWDCVGGSDEIGCARYSCPGQYKCANESSCILLHQLCDDFRHCPLGDDEWFCDLTCPESCTCTGLYINCRDSNITAAAFARMPKETRKLDLSGNALGPDLAGIDFSFFADLGELILQNNQLEVIRSRKFIQLTNLYKLDLRFNRIKVIEEAAFAGLRQVTSLMLENNPDLAEIESNAFVGLISLRTLNISNTRLDKIKENLFMQMSSLQTLTLVDNQIDSVEKGAFNDLSSLTGLDLRGNPITYFPKDMFSQLKSLRSLSTDSFKFCCLASGVGVPFSRCYPPQDEISDCQDLMSNTVQRLILWVLGIVAFFGNLLVVIWRFKTRNQTNRVSSTLILSLGCSDFLMGIYLLIIASVDEYYRGRYIENSDYWKNSGLCQFCGFLSTISSEMSVATLVFITIDRLISISFSFSNYRFTLKFTYRLLTITWIVMLLVSSLPLLPIDYFKGQFYSRSGVCLALHITTRRSPGWEYSVAIFLFINLLAFLIIAFCYCYMYKTITTSTKKMKNMITQKQDRETRIGRQMLFIVVSNFLCWFPVIIMGMLALAGITIPGGAYSWTAVFVLPLNSATDPLIYTLVQFIQNFIANRQADRQMFLATGGGSSGGRGGGLFRMHSATHAFNTSTKLLRGMSKMSSELSNHLLVAESSITTSNQNGYTQSGNLLLRQSSYVQNQSALLLRPPLGYQTLTDFMRNEEHISTRDLLEICHSISANLKEFHDMGFALGAITFENIFVTKQPIAVPQSDNNNMTRLTDVNEDGEGVEGEQVEYRLQTYIPGFGFAYKVSENDEDPEDYAVNVDEYGVVVKRMLQLFHARQLKSSMNSVNHQANNNNNQSNGGPSSSNEPQQQSNSIPNNNTNSP